MPKTPQFALENLSALNTLGAIIVWSHFLRQKRLPQQRRGVLPNDPSSSNGCNPTDMALSCVGGTLGGQDKLSSVARLQGEAALAQVARR